MKVDEEKVEQNIKRANETLEYAKALNMNIFEGAYFLGKKAAGSKVAKEIKNLNPWYAGKKAGHEMATDFVEFAGEWWSE